MRVGIEKRYIDSYKRIVKEANKLLKNKKKLIVPKDKYKKSLQDWDISVEKKKQKLANNLHKLTLYSFSVTQSKKAFSKVKKHAPLIRDSIQKIKAINNYIEETLLKELGIIKKSLVLKALKSKKPQKYLERERGLSKNYIDNIEHTVYKLMHEIVFFDEKLIKGYSKKEIKVVKKEKTEIKDIEMILRTQSELLDALEAKIPPANKIKANLFSKGNFNKWAPFVFALLSSFEAEYEKEKSIFSKLKKNNKLRKRIESKIKHIVNEKKKMLELRQNRALSMESSGKIGEDYRQVFHEYVSAAGL